MNEQDERAFKRFFQQIKSMSFKNFVKEMNVMHTRAYAVAQRHYREAMFICLTPKQRDAVEEKVVEIRELWDGMETVKTENTKAELLLENEVIEELRELKRINAELQEEIIRLKGDKANDRTRSN